MIRISLKLSRYPGSVSIDREGESQSGTDCPQCVAASHALPNLGARSPPAVSDNQRLKATVARRPRSAISIRSRETDVDRTRTVETVRNRPVCLFIISFIRALS